MSDAIGVLVMAYGTAAGPEDIERYYTDIRGGRAPSAEHLAELRDRYAAIGDVFPLLATTTAQAEGLVARLNADGDRSFRAYLGMKHSAPTIPEGVAAMHDDGIERAVAIVMAPHWSGMSIETYVERTLQAIDAQGAGIDVSFVRSFHDHPAFVAYLADRVAETMATLTDDERRDATVLFTAHSLPVRRVDDGTLRCKTCDCDEACRYEGGLRRTGDLVAGRLGLADRSDRVAVGGPHRRPMVGAVGRRGHPRGRRRGTLGGGRVLRRVRGRPSRDAVRPRHRGRRGRARGGRPVRPHAYAQRRPRLLRRARGGGARPPRVGPRLRPP